MTHELFDKLATIAEPAYRNTPGIGDTPQAFDDLSDHPADWDLAKAISTNHHLPPSVLHYHAIDYVFELTKWNKTRFGDGSFPIWYGSLDITTTFYETVYHWRKFLSKTPDLFQAAEDRPIETIRNIYTASCRATLIDLRNKAAQHPALVDQDNYDKTQLLGAKLAQDGFPGLVTQSARYKAGNNLVIFNRQVLSTPCYNGRYTYTLESINTEKVCIKNAASNDIILELGVV